MKFTKRNSITVLFITYDYLNHLVELNNFLIFLAAVEGNIGAGKTTFLKNFDKYSNSVEVIPEPVQKWRDVKGHNLLEKFYQEPNRWSMLLQTYVQLTMVQNHSLPCTKPIRIMERSMLRHLQITG